MQRDVREGRIDNHGSRTSRKMIAEIEMPSQFTPCDHNYVNTASTAQEFFSGQ